VGEKESFGSVDVGKGWTLEEINEELQVWLDLPPFPYTLIPYSLYLYYCYRYAIITTTNPEIFLGMPYCSNPQHPTILLPLRVLRGTLHLDPNPLLISLPLRPCRQLPPRNSLHLWSAQLPPRPRPPGHRPLPPLHYGRIRNWWVAR